MAATLATPAFAAGYFRLSGIYSSEETGQGTTTKSSRTLLDLGAGYTWSSGFTLGGLYGTEKRESGDSSTDRTSLGPTIGYLQKGGGFFALGTYHSNPNTKSMTARVISWISDIASRYQASA
ncbi:MAG: hypothetical protein HC902_10820 [Calothrix sp. SM1_5_4]|nr:hypothetical protein [Calothrix sp. SM1_5_4]